MLGGGGKDQEGCPLFFNQQVFIMRPRLQLEECMLNTYLGMQGHQTMSLLIHYFSVGLDE